MRRVRGSLAILAIAVSPLSVMVLAGEGGALGIGSKAFVALFAAVWAVALTGFLRSDGNNADTRKLHLPACYPCVRLQPASAAACRPDRNDEESDGCRSMR
jgi:hypothetical protein